MALKIDSEEEKFSKSKRVKFILRTVQTKRVKFFLDTRVEKIFWDRHANFESRGFEIGKISPVFPSPRKIQEFWDAVYRLEYPKVTRKGEKVLLADFPSITLFNTG
jgi:hypothetical protein